MANDVGWFVPDDVIADQDADVTFTAVGYRPIVSIEMPHDYRPEGGAAVIASWRSRSRTTSSWSRTAGSAQPAQRSPVERLRASVISRSTRAG